MFTLTFYFYIFQCQWTIPLDTVAQAAAPALWNPLPQDPASSCKYWGTVFYGIGNCYRDVWFNCFFFLLITVAVGFPDLYL